MSDNNQDELFDDSTPTGGTKPSEAEITTDKKVEKEEEDDKEGKGGEEEGKTGAKEASGTPPEDKEGQTDENQNEKMIPESRLKAAIKDIQTKLDAANAELNKRSAIPVPDKEKDPDGYAFHVRMTASTEIMRETRSDYDTVIAHYIEMAKANPDLNQKVYDHPIPAKFAYDLAKADMEVQEARAVRGSDEWKEFQEFKKQKAAQAKQEEQNAEQNKVGDQVKAGLSKVPNLNKATDVSTKKKSQSDDSDELFEGKL